MKKIIVIILMTVLVATTAAYFLGAFKWATPPTGEPVPINAASPTPTHSVSPTVKTAPSPTVVQSPSPTRGNVDFTFYVDPPTGSGLSRTFSAKISNVGNTDAHNVWVKIEARSAGSKIQINSRDFLRVDIGTIKTGETVSEQATLDFGIVDAVKIMQNGAQFTLTVYSDEKTQAFGYNYTP